MTTRSTKKLKHFRRDQFKGPKRRKPAVRRLNQEVKRRVIEENNLIQSLIRDSLVRRKLFSHPNVPLSPLTVWTDFAHSEDYTELSPYRLQKWSEIGQYLKVQLLFQVALEFGAYSFTARVRPDLEARWVNNDINVGSRIKKLLWQSLRAQDLMDTEYFYVIEGKGRKGRGKTRVHLHGFFIAEDPYVSTKFKTALENAISAHPKGRAAAGIAAKSGPSIDIERAYDIDTNDGRGRGRWVNYITKNVTKYDKRIGPDNIHISRPATQLVREFWALIRQDPIGP